MKQLNETELQVMRYLWKLKKGFLKDIVDKFPEPKPAYTTISTLIQRMCAKNYIGFTKLGRDKYYFPILQKHEYFSEQLKGIITNFFNDSPAQFASFFTTNTELSPNDLQELKEVLQQQINNQKTDKP